MVEVTAEGPDQEKIMTGIRTKTSENDVSLILDGQYSGSLIVRAPPSHCSYTVASRQGSISVESVKEGILGQEMLAPNRA